MSDYVSLGATPAGESCAQVGQDDYYEQSQIETKAYINQLRRLFTEPLGARFATKSFPHDFGTYREVCVIYDDDKTLAVNFAYDVEGKIPENWDEQARAELLERGYRHLK